MIRVALPVHLRTLAGLAGEARLEVATPVTIGNVLDTLEKQYPALRGTVREHQTLKRRPFVRFFACEQDLSHEPANFELPEAVAKGTEPFMIIGALAGG